MTDNQNIQWRRTAVEAAAVVASILLAFSIDAWWSSKSEQARTDELLQALSLEWASDLQRIDQLLDQYDESKLQIVRAIKIYYSVNSELTPEDGMEISRGLYYSTYKPSTAAHTVLLSHGLDRISHAGLRAAIAQWPSDLAEISPEKAALEDFGFNKLRTATARIAQDLGQSWYDVENDWAFQTYGVDPRELWVVAFADDNYIYLIRLLENLLDSYQSELEIVRSTLVGNLALIEAR